MCACVYVRAAALTVFHNFLLACPAGDGWLPADLRTLVVEDDPLNLAVVTKFLEMSGVSRIETASDGAAGVAALMKGDYDFVLTDVHMPVMSGLDMIQTVAVRRCWLAGWNGCRMVILFVLCLK